MKITARVEKSMPALVSCYDQFLVMCLAQYAAKNSLRDIEASLIVVEHRLYHSGISYAVPRNTLAKANEQRDRRIYRDFGQALIKRVRPLYAVDPFRLDIDNMVYAFDSSTISLCLKLCPWAKFRTTKASIKMHTLLDLRGNLPVYILLTDASEHDVKALDTLCVEMGAIYLLDKGYIDFFRLFNHIHKIDRLIGTARSNKVSVALGFQELPQLEADYGKVGMQKIITTVGNVVSGSARSKETLEWLSSDNDAQEALQEMSNRKFRTDNNVLIIKTFPKVGIDLHASMGFSADLQEMTSVLYDPVTASSDGKSIPDSLRNDTDYHRFDVRANLGMTYRHRDFSIATGISPVYSYVFSSDHISGEDKSKDKVYFNPHIVLDWKITPNLSFLASGSLIGNLGAASGIYSGYIMTDYRLIGSRDGRIAEGLHQNYSAELRYADALLSLFGSVKADYRRNDSNLMYGTEYFSSLSRVRTYDIQNTSQGWGIEGKIEKRFNAISTTVGIPVGYRRNLMDILRQGTITNTAIWSLPVGLEVSSRLAANAFLEYYARYVRSGSEILGENNEQTDALKAINALHQRLRLDFVFFKRVTLKISGEHYLNDAISSGSRNIFFLDASLKLKAKKIEYILEGRNLLDNNFYNQRLWSDITNYQYNYLLRPVTVMFKIRFNLGV